jgi:hypothetical protein
MFVRRSVVCAVAVGAVLGGAANEVAAATKPLMPKVGCWAGPTQPPHACGNMKGVQLQFAAASFGIQYEGEGKVVALEGALFGSRCLGTYTVTSPKGVDYTVNHQANVQKKVWMKHDGTFSYSGPTVVPGDTVDGPDIDIQGKFTSSTTANVTVTIHSAGCGGPHRYEVKSDKGY